MRRAQITLFIMLGIVLLVSVLILIYAMKSLRPSTPVGTVEVSDTLARTCLQRTTDNAIAALEDDGLVLVDESGPIALPGNDPYLSVIYDDNPASASRSPFGMYRFIGLCGKEITDPNGIGRYTSNRFSCDNLVYQYTTVDYLGRNIPAVQLQIMDAITNQMRECINSSGSATVIVQTDGILVEWDNPTIQYSPKTPLHKAFKAAQFVIQKEVSDEEFSLDRIENGAYPDRILDCDGCDGVTVSYDGDVTENGPDTILVEVEGAFAMRMQTADRGIAVKDSTDIFRDAYDLPGPMRITCKVHGDISLSTHTISQAVQKARTCAAIEYESGDAIYTFDDDILTLELYGPSAGAYYFSLNDGDDCGYPSLGIQDIACGPKQEFTFQKEIVMVGGVVQSYNPLYNTLSISRHCTKDFTLQGRISDGTYSWEAIIDIPVMDSIEGVDCVQ